MTKTTKNTKKDVIPKNMPLEQMPIIPLNLNQKLVKIRKCIGYIQKTEKSQDGMYVNPAILLKKIRDKMDEYNIILVPSIVSSTLRKEHAPTKNNKDQKDFLSELIMEYIWIDADSNEKLKVPWFATGNHMRDSSMSFGKALTYSERYFFLKFFQIPTAKDDPEYFEQKTMTDEQKEQKEELAKEKLKQELIKKEKIKQELIKEVSKITIDSDLRDFYNKNKGKYDPKIFDYILVKRSNEIKEKGEERFDGKQ